jgi:hypothetical protein
VGSGAANPDLLRGQLEYLAGMNGNRGV